MAGPPFDFQQKIDPQLLQQIVQSGQNSGWGPVVSQIGDAIQKGIKQKQQQAALQQLIQGMGTPQTQGQPPTAGVGGFNQNAPPQTSGYPPFNGMDPVKLLGLLAKSDPQGAQELVGKLIQQKMQGPNVRDQYLQWKMSQQPQTKTGSGQGSWRMIQTRDGSAYMYNESTGETKPIKGPMAPPAPKPVNPVPAAALDVKVQQANQGTGSFLDRLFSSPKPIVNPLNPKGPQQTSQSPTATGPNGEKIKWNGSAWVPQ